MDINYHGIVALGMVLTIVAVVKLESGADGSFDTMLSLLKAGAGISALAFALLAIWAILTFRRVKNLWSSRKGPQTRPGMIVSCWQRRLGYGAVRRQISHSCADQTSLASLWRFDCPSIHCLASCLRHGVFTAESGQAFLTRYPVSCSHDGP